MAEPFYLCFFLKKIYLNTICLILQSSKEELVRKRQSVLCTPSKEPIAPGNMYCRIHIHIRGVFFQESCPRALLPSVQDHVVMKLGTDHGTRHTCRWPSCSTRKEWRSMAGRSVEKGKCHCACRGREAAPGDTFAAGLQAAAVSERVPQAGARCRSYWVSVGVFGEGKYLMPSSSAVLWSP